MHHTYGTAYYIAPEVLEGKYTEKCDLWSIGVILYIMLSGRPPFKGNNDREILKKVMVGKYTLDGELWSKRSEPVKTMIQALLEKDPTKRLTAKQALDHPWI
jgi:calcium-dependent protein kinase